MDLSEAKALVNTAWDATTSNTLRWSDKSDKARSALSAFWAGKQESYADDPQAWDRLDLSAHKAWAYLAEAGMVEDTPPAQKKYQDEAQQAYAGAKSLATVLEDAQSAAALDHNATESNKWYDYAVKHGVDDSYSAAFKERMTQLEGIASIFANIPWWVYLVAGGAALWFWKGRR